MSVAQDVELILQKQEQSKCEAIEPTSSSAPSAPESGQTNTCTSHHEEIKKLTTRIKELTEERETCLMMLGSLLQAITPFAAKHKQDRCFCAACNTLRRVVLMAAKVVNTLQPLTL